MAICDKSEVRRLSKVVIHKLEVVLKQIIQFRPKRGHQHLWKNVVRNSFQQDVLHF